MFLWCFSTGSRRVVASVNMLARHVIETRQRTQNSFSSTWSVSIRLSMIIQFVSMLISRGKCHDYRWRLRKPSSSENLGGRSEARVDLRSQPIVKRRHDHTTVSRRKMELIPWFIHDLALFIFIQAERSETRSGGFDSREGPGLCGTREREARAGIALQRRTRRGQKTPMGGASTCSEP